MLLRRVRDYKVSFDEDFARLILEEVGKFEIDVGKWLPFNLAKIQSDILGRVYEDLMPGNERNLIFLP